MLDDFNGLNSEQLEAVKCTEGPLLILAGAGSGKTTVLINRVYYLIKYCGIAPWNILAITFTNKAAGELKDRLAIKLGSDSEAIWALTFHSCCVRMLRRDADRLGFEKNFTIYDTGDSVALIKHILKDLKLDDKMFPPKTVLAEISRAKDEKMFPENYAKKAEGAFDLHKKVIANIYAEYMKRMRDSNAMDFDDLMLYTVVLLEKYEDVRSYWQNRFEYIMIDEYQDTNNLQYLFASLLTNAKNNICVVGDDDQSIYKFRGATIRNILSFEDQFSDCRTIRLEQNYRSTGHILEAANNVIRNNTQRKGKELWTDAGDGNKIELYCADDQDDEAQYVASRILSGISKGDNYRDFAVLYRMNAQSNALEYAFKRNGIPYRIFGGTKFFDRAEVKDILSYLCVVMNPDDSLRLERIVNNPPRGIGNTSLLNAQKAAAREEKSLFEIMSHADCYEELARSSMKMRLFARMIDELRDFSRENSSEFVYDEIIEKTGYLRMLEEKDTAEDNARAENVREIRSSILTYIQETGDETLEGYLANVALYTDLDNYDDSTDMVTMMTMHSSKGLEFPVVFIVGMEEGIFPGIKSSTGDELEEERRLCYVAITRAKKELYILCARHRMLFGYTNANRASRFIDEIPDEHINRYLPKGQRYTDPVPESISYRRSSYDRISGLRAVASNPPQISLEYELGSDVVHNAFGPGVITKISPIGNDWLIEINFESVGSKKLMFKAASKFLKKA